MTENTKIFLQRLWRSVQGAFLPAMRTAWWLTKLMVPVSLGISVLDYLGVVAWVSGGLEPLFGLMGLDGRGALVWISAVAVNPYTAIAVMFAVGIGLREAVILTAMTLICHNLIIETAIQKRSGASAAAMVALRIGASLLAGVLLNLAVPASMAGQLHGSAAAAGHAETWGAMFYNWGMGLAPLLVKMAVLVTSLNILQSILREFGILSIIAWPLRPLMRVFGLPLNTSFLWIICNVIGLTYGGAALIDELQRGEATLPDARLLNTHVAISHSLLEDTILFAAIGIPVFWILVPRLLLAVAAVWIQRLTRVLNKESRYAVRTQGR